MAEYEGTTALMRGTLAGIAEDFEDIRRSAKGVSDETFAKTIQFCLLISEGQLKGKAHESVFGKLSDNRKMATMLINRKYASQILERMIAGNHLLLADKHLAALEEMFDIGMDKGESTRNRIDALDKFAGYTKKPEAIKIDVDTTLHLGVDMVEKIDSLTKSLAAKGSMIGSDGEIIDTVVLD